MNTQERVRIMPLGDSITQGFNSSNLRGYRSALWDLMQRAGWSIDFDGSLEEDNDANMLWRHEGHYGWCIDRLCDHVNSSLRHFQPHVILLHIGTNDIVRGCNAVVALTRLERLLDCIHTMWPTALVCVAQITPLGLESLNTRVQKYNQLIPSLVQSKIRVGRAMRWVDMYNAVSLSTIKDKIHTNDDGYIAMAHVWFQVLQEWHLSHFPEK